MLYAGLMITNQGPKVLEFNVRFGDPETQVVLARLKTDLFELLDAAVDDRLDTVSLEWDPRPAVTVVMAAEGYPGPLRARLRDSRISRPPTGCPTSRSSMRAPRSAPTPPSAAKAVSSATAAGFSTSPPWAQRSQEAQARAYEAARAVKFPGAWYRRDIGGRPAGREPDVESTEVGFGTVIMSRRRLAILARCLGLLLGLCCAADRPGRGRS